MAIINTKFDIGDEVFTFEKTEKGELLVNRGKITEICIDKDGATYYIDEIFAEYSEDDVLSVNCISDEIYDKIYELTKREENGPEPAQRN